MGGDAGDCLTTETGFELIRHMAAAEDTSWEYTLGRIDEHVEQRLGRVEFDVKGIQKTIDEKMLNKTTFFTFTSMTAGLLAAMIALK